MLRCYIISFKWKTYNFTWKKAQWNKSKTILDIILFLCYNYYIIRDMESDFYEKEKWDIIWNDKETL